MKEYVEGWLLWISDWSYWTASGQNKQFDQHLSGLHCVYYTLACTARQSRIPYFSKKHTLLFPKHKQTFNAWAVFTPLLPNSSSPLSSREVWVPPSFGRDHTYLNLASFLSALVFTLLLCLILFFKFAPCFLDQVGFQGWRKPEFPSPEPWEQHSQPSGGFTWFQSPDSKIRAAWSPWSQVSAWHKLW